MTNASSPHAPELSDRQKWQAFGVCVGVAALTILDLSKVNVGLPSIESSLDAGPSSLQLIVAGYALAFGLALVPSGRLGDLKSRKLMFVIGLTAFTLASLFCALAPTVELLVVRCVLGEDVCHGSCPVRRRRSRAERCASAKDSPQLHPGAPPERAGPPASRSSTEACLLRLLPRLRPGHVLARRE